MTAPVGAINPVATISTTLTDSWKTLGAITGSQPPDLLDCRFFIYGKPKTGKTTFLSSFPETLIIDLEGGGHSVPNPAAARIWVPGYMDTDLTTEMREIARKRNRPIASLQAVLNKLESEAKAGTPAFRHIVFDSADSLQELVMIQMSKEKGKDIREYGQGSGWGLMAERCVGLAQRLGRLGYGWSMTGHYQLELVEVGGSNVEVCRPTITPKFYRTLGKEVEYILEMTRNLGPLDQTTKTRRVEVYLVSQPMEPRREDFASGGRVTLPAKVGPIPMTGYTYLNEIYRKAAGLVAG